MRWGGGMNVGVPPIQVYPSRNLVKSSVAIIFQSFPPCLKIGGKLSPRNPVGRCQGVAMATSQIGNQISLKLRHQSSFLREFFPLPLPNPFKRWWCSQRFKIIPEKRLFVSDYIDDWSIPGVKRLVMLKTVTETMMIDLSRTPSYTIIRKKVKRKKFRQYILQWSYHMYRQNYGGFG